MRIVAKTKDFKKALSIGAQFAGKNKIIPALSNVKITTKDNRIKFESSDQHNFMRKFGTVVSCDQDGSFLVDYSALNGYVGLIPTEEFVMYVDFTTLQMTIKHDMGEFSMPILKSETFPEFPQSTESKKIQIEAGLFADWCALAQLYAARDEFKPQMSGMHIFIKDGEIGYCATDAHTLATDKVKYYGETVEDFGVTLDITSLRAIQQLLKIENDTDNFTLELTDKNAFVKAGTSTVVCRLVEGAYPNFHSVIPKDNDKVVRFSKEDMANALKRASMAAPNTFLCKMNIEPGSISITMEDLDFAKKTEDKVVATSTDSITIGVNWQKLILVLEGIDSDLVVCRLSNEGRPLLFHEDSEGINKTIILMPMMLNK